MSINIPARAAVSLAKLQALQETLELLTRRGNARDVGRRALLLSYLLSPIGTQRALAKRLGVSPGRAAQMLGVLRRAYGLSRRDTDN